MNPNEPLETLFENLQGAFDQAQPPAGHRERFRQRLNTDGGAGSAGRSWWKPLSIAATVALLLGVGLTFLRPVESLEAQVAEISPEASRTSFYFANLIQQEVQELEQLSGPETEPLIQDTLQQLEELETDYRQLEEDLVAGGNSKMILRAMVTNFQTRIDLLQDVMAQIEQIQTLKNETHATHTL
ncbi:hypothetical protein OZ410_09735 [Robiginitalea sp. M366]|uniref:hypothetical protein n=1 Tax=Robiginitalea aestuariiviva TaxID=3036903 RepID=UPI00240D18EA|nr:hypothetical protein [Robiginitalea aestuariiviva]MDG1572597.1 hypothetical protein [Robiginitalea aestuariiviva]